MVIILFLNHPMKTPQPFYSLQSGVQFKLISIFPQCSLHFFFQRINILRYKLGYVLYFNYFIHSNPTQ